MVRVPIINESTDSQDRGHTETLAPQQRMEGDW